jgi:hypothetical protein
MVNKIFQRANATIATLISSRSQMRFRLMVFLSAMVGLLVGGCSTLSTHSETDTTVSFTPFKTFAWLPTSPTLLKESLELRNESVIIQTIADKELERRGLSADTTNPDLLFRYTVKYVNRIGHYTVRDYTYEPYYYGGWGRGWYPRYYGFGTPYVVHYQTYPVKLKDGSLLVEAIDRKTGNVIWRSWSEETVYRNGTIADAVPDAVRQIFDRYPIAPR